MGRKERDRPTLVRESAAGEDTPSRRARAASAGALAAAIVVVAILVCVAHWPALSAKALSFDDSEYLTENYLVQKPSWASARTFLSEVFTPSTVGGYYQPLAMISLMLDHAMGGRSNYLRPFHRTSLALHVANTGLVIVLLYSLLGSMPRARGSTGSAGDDVRERVSRVCIAAIVGLLFGLHPLTIEPIPWVGERKTLLAAFFALWCLVFYVRYSRTHGWVPYAFCLVAYALALLSKPTSTPLPAAMLLLDIWPLRRLNARAVWEKVPLFVVGGVSSVITYVSQRDTAAVLLPGQYSLWRIPLLLCHNIIFYLYKIVWPANLSSHYPFPEPLNLSSHMVLAGVVGTCILVPALVFSLRWTRALLVGWLIFFITILPAMQVIGFSNVIASDKYAYLPSIGLLLVLAWAVNGLWAGASARQRGRAARIGTFGVVAVLGLSEALATRYALRPWSDTVSLYRHMIDLAPRAPSTHFGLGAYLASQGRLTEARDEFRKSLELDPNQPAAHCDLGITLHSLGKTDEAVRHLSEALRLSPNDFAVLNNYALVLSDSGNIDGAIEQLTRAVHLKPDAPRAHFNLGEALARRGRHGEAVPHYREAIRIKPDYAEAYSRLADVLADMGKGQEAAGYYLEALRIAPHYAEAHSNYAAELVAQGKPAEAAKHAAEAVRLKPGFAKAQYNLALALAKQDRNAEAITHLREAIRLKPDFAEAHNNLAALLQGQGKSEEAVRHFSEAVRLKPDYLEAHYNLGCVFEAQGKLDAAIGEYHQALRIDPKNATVRERLGAAVDRQASLPAN